MKTDICELIWPRLDDSTPGSTEPRAEDIVVSEDNLDVSIELAKFNYEEQRDRIARVESKSSIFIGFFGTAVAIIVFALKDILLQDDKTIFHYATALVGSILVIYILQVMRYSLRALGAQNYHVPDERVFAHGDNKKTVAALATIVKLNHDTINRKVDFMTMANKFTGRVIFILALIAFSTLIVSIYPVMSLFSAAKFDFLSVPVSFRWTDAILFLLLVSHICICIRFYKKSDSGH